MGATEIVFHMGCTVSAVQKKNWLEDLAPAIIDTGTYIIIISHGGCMGSITWLDEIKFLLQGFLEEGKDPFVVVCHPYQCKLAHPSIANYIVGDWECSTAVRIRWDCDNDTCGQIFIGPH